MRGPTPEARAEAKRRYESGEKMAPLAASMGIPRGTLRRICESEKWIAPPDAPLAQTIKAQSKANVIDMTTRKMYEHVEQSGLIEKIAEAHILDLSRDVYMTNRLGESVDKTIDRFLEGKIQPGKMQNEADVLKSVIIAAKSYAELRRVMAGKTAGDASIEMGPKLDPNVTLTVRRLPTSKEDWERSKSA